MTRERERLVRLLFMMGDLIVTALCYLAAIEIRIKLPPEMSIAGLQLRPMGPLEPIVRLLPAVLLIWMVMMFLFNTADYRTPVITAARRYLNVVIAGGASIVGLAFAAKLFFVPRSFALLFVLLNLAGLVFARYAMRMLASVVLRREVGKHRLLLVGAPEDIPRMLQMVEDDTSWGFRVPGILLDAPYEDEPGRIGGVDVLGHVADLRDVLLSKHIDTVMFALSRERRFLLDDAIAVCEELGARVTIAFFPFEHLAPRVSLERMAGIPLLAFQRTPTDDVALALKRLMDVALAAAAVIALTPVWLITALAIKLESSGPIFYKQTRGGIMGRPFGMLKFRTMVVDAEQKLDALKAKNEVEGGGPMFKMKNDPRVTRVGRFLRRSSIDELPQLFNVLRNEMSLVGPRPSLPKEIKKLEPWQRRRLSVKPGITCIWQVSGRSQTAFDRWMRMDLEYIDNWSLWLDIKLLFKTVPAVIRGDGAY